MYFDKNIALLLIEGAARHIGDTVDDGISDKEIQLAYDFATYTYLRDEAYAELERIRNKKEVAC